VSIDDLFDKSSCEEKSKRGISMYNLFLMRHGRSLADDEQKCEGRYDSPLTETGRKQAMNTAQYFCNNGIKFDGIFTSTLSRAKETAEIINQRQNTKIIQNELFVERDNGVLAGKTYEEVKKRYSGKPQFHHPYRYLPENSGENDAMLHSRAILAINSVFNLNDGVYLVVSHGGILNALMRYIVGASIPFGESGIAFCFGDNGMANLHYTKSNNHWVLVSFINFE
jgi:2,3-bisphosphoglycerate-dependent phosphoglycerate mutase